MVALTDVNDDALVAGVAGIAQRKVVAFRVVCINQIIGLQPRCNALERSLPGPAVFKLFNMFRGVFRHGRFLIIRISQLLLKAGSQSALTVCSTYSAG